MSILTRLQRGEVGGVDMLFESYADGLFHYALTLVGESHAAEDVVQEVFTELVSSPDRLRHVLNLKSYLFQAVRNRSLSSRGRALREQPASQSEHLFESSVQDAQEDLALRQAVEGLPDEQREVLVLKVYQGLTFSAIGALLGISQNTAASRYRYALGALRSELAPEEMNSERPRVAAKA